MPYTFGTDFSEQNLAWINKGNICCFITRRRNLINHLMYIIYCHYKSCLLPQRVALTDILVTVSLKRVWCQGPYRDAPEAYWPVVRLSRWSGWHLQGCERCASSLSVMETLPGWWRIVSWELEEWIEWVGKRDGMSLKNLLSLLMCGKAPDYIQL